jgi:hypothetical protein
MILFEHGEYFNGVFLILGIGFVLLVLYSSRRFRALTPFPVFKNTCRSGVSELIRGLVLLGAFASAYIAVLGPHRQEEEKIPIREALTVVISVDCSLSMLAPVGGMMANGEIDRTPRYSAVLKAVHKVFSVLTDDRKGVSCFSGRVNSSSVLTMDYKRVLRQRIDAINERLIATIGIGTNFSAALDGCFNLFDRKDKRRKVCVIFSDGEAQGEADRLRSELEEKMRFIRTRIRKDKMDVSFYLVGVGDSTQKFNIPRKDINGNFAGFVSCDKDDNLRETQEDGKLCETQPDPKYLKRIATTIGGEFVDLSKGGKIEEVLQEILQKERLVMEYKISLVSSDKSWWFILIVCACLIYWFFAPRRFFKTHDY